jgi:hypothetical protein
MLLQRRQPSALCRVQDGCAKGVEKLVLGKSQELNEHDRLGGILGWSLVLLYAVAAASAVVTVELITPSNSTETRMWTEAKQLFNSLNCLSRPSRGGSANSSRYESIQDSGCCAHARPVCKQGFGLPALSGSNLSCTAGSVVDLAGSCSSAAQVPSGSTAVPSCASGTTPHSPGRKRKRKRSTPPAACQGEMFYQCTECEQRLGTTWRSFQSHLDHSPYCAENNAQFVHVSVEQEATEKLNDRVGEASYAADVQSHMVAGYGELIYKRMVDKTCVQEAVKENVVDPLVHKMKEEIYRRLAKTPAERQSLEAQIGTVFQVHRGIETSAKQEGTLRRMVSPVEPKKRELVDRPDSNGLATGTRRGDFVYDVPIADELQMMLKQDPTLLAQLRQASDSWGAQRPAPGSSRTVYCDISDGAAMSTHPGLGHQADRSDGRYP